MLKEMTSKESIELEDKYGAHNYHPLPVVLDRGEGVYLWDTEGKKYFDFLSAYSAVNQGHCHPKITKVLIEQAQKLTLTSRAFYNTSLGTFSKFISDYFKHDKTLLMSYVPKVFDTGMMLESKWDYTDKNNSEKSTKFIEFNQKITSKKNNKSFFY